MENFQIKAGSFFQDFSLFCPALITLWKSTWELCPLTSLHKRYSCWVLFFTEIKSVNLTCVSPASQLVSVINKKLLVIVLGDQNGGCIIIGAFLSLSQILTKDSVTVSVDGVVYFRIQCPISSVANVSNAHSSTRLLAQTTLRNVLGTKNLAELLSDREGISLSMQVSNLCVHRDPEGSEEIFKGIVVCKIQTHLYSGDP